MKYTIITAFMLIACTADPQGLQTIDSNTIIVKIIDRNEALRQIDMPVNHANGGK